MPMAISFVGASVIWKLVYDARPEGTDQIGVLNALYIYFGGTEPKTWLTIPFWNNFFLMMVLIWIQTGFAMVILSAALRGIPEETVEAAIVDGASPFQIFFKIKVPQIKTTILVVWTTITITVLKVFDIVFAMTNGQWETQVLANYMYDKLFRANDWGVRIGGGHDHHAAGDADPCLERAQRAPRNALRRAGSWTILQEPNLRCLGSCIYLSCGACGALAVPHRGLADLLLPDGGSDRDQRLVEGPVPGRTEPETAHRARRRRCRTGRPVCD